jgi:hypothetical protein
MNPSKYDKIIQVIEYITESADHPIIPSISDRLAAQRQLDYLIGWIEGSLNKNFEDHIITPNQPKNIGATALGSKAIELMDKFIFVITKADDLDIIHSDIISISNEWSKAKREIS